MEATESLQHPDDVFPAPTQHHAQVSPMNARPQQDDQGQEEDPGKRADLVEGHCLFEQDGIKVAESRGDHDAAG